MSISQRITTLPDPPTLADADFDTKAQTFLSALPDWGDEVDTLGQQANTLADAIDSDKSAAEAALSSTESARDAAIAARDSAVAVSGAVGYSAATTYNTPDAVIGSDGHTYRCTGSGVLGDDPVTSTSGDWQRITAASAGAWVSVSSSRTAQPGDNLYIDTSGGSVVITLPAAPANGSMVRFIDPTSTWATNPVTVARNGATIQGLSEDMTADIDATVFALLYLDGDWRLVP